jgi:hypothetical protein
MRRSLGERGPMGSHAVDAPAQAYLWGRYVDDVRTGRVVEEITPPHRRMFRRPPPPSSRCRGIDMRRSTFLTLIVCWGLGLALILASALTIRFFA